MKQESLPCLLALFIGLVACSYLTIQNTKHQQRYNTLKIDYDSLNRLKMDSTAIWLTDMEFEDLQNALENYNRDTLYQNMSNDTPFRIFCKKAWNDRQD